MKLSTPLKISLFILLAGESFRVYTIAEAHKVVKDIREKAYKALDTPTNEELERENWLLWHYYGDTERILKNFKIEYKSTVKDELKKIEKEFEEEILK